MHFLFILVRIVPKERHFRAVAIKRAKFQRDEKFKMLLLVTVEREYIFGTGI